LNICSADRLKTRQANVCENLLPQTEDFDLKGLKRFTGIRIERKVSNNFKAAKSDSIRTGVFMRNAKLFFTILAALFSLQESFAQSSQKDDPKDDQVYRQQETALEKQEKALNELMTRYPMQPAGNGGNRALTREELKKEEKRIKGLIAPRSEDARKYQDFLRQPGTGLFRLFPDFDCEQGRLIRVGGDCENFIPGSSVYSFRQKDHQLFAALKFYDLKLSGAFLISREFLSQGILTEIGDIPLENVTPESDGVRFLIDLKPETQSTEAKKQFAQIARGLKSGSYSYSKSAVAQENMTYALRIVAYRLPAGFRYRKDLTDLRMRGLAQRWLHDKREDLTVAFRIIRKEPGGDLTIIWRELKRQKAPEIEFSKNDIVSEP
jgi:hypothetical protein